MKTLIAVFALFVSIAQADQRFETVGGFCHFVTVQGFKTNNDDNEVFFANCLNSIRQKANGDGEGSTLITVEYPPNSAPFFNDYYTSGSNTGVDCVMVDSNGTQYTTQVWYSRYSIESDKLDECRSAFKKQEYKKDCDYDKDGFLTFNDINSLKRSETIKIRYELICKDAAQQ